MTALGWPQEAALRMLHNNLDPDVAERPDDLVVYGGTGRAARDWPSFDALVRTLTTLRGDETMLVQSGRPVGVVQTHEWAPRVLLANSNLVGEWSTWKEFRRLEALGLTMYGQMTAGSWIYIGTQGILQGTYETFAAIAKKRFGGTLAGTLTLTAGAGGMGGAQPLAVTMNDGVCLCVDVDPTRLERRVEHRYLDEWTRDLDERHRTCRGREGRAHRAERRTPRQCGHSRPRAPSARGRGRHRHGSDRPRTTRSAISPRASSSTTGTTTPHKKPDEFMDRARESMATRRGHGRIPRRRRRGFDYGNSLRAEALLGGYPRAFDYPGFVPAYIRPLFCEGKGPFRWVALSGDPADIHRTDRAILELFPEDDALHRWITKAQDKVAFQGLPARICWLGYGERDKAGVAFNDLVANGELSAPIVIGRDHLDCGSVASPYRETESMLDGSDAIADWPLLNALVNTSSGASWVSIHHGGGVGIGRSLHAGQVTVADGTALAREKISRVLTNDPGTGIMRHVDAGYATAEDVAEARGVRVPMRES